MRCLTGTGFCFFFAKGVTGEMAYDTVLVTVYISFPSQIQTNVTKPVGVEWEKTH